MKFIIGLGNPGEKYKNNRHNVGFMFLDFFLEDKKVAFKIDKYTESEKTELEKNGEKIILAKPQTFMNDSGRAVRKLVSSIDDLYIIHDDLDIKLGEFKIQKGKGPKAHNGVDSVEESLQTKDFWRVRIGVDSRPSENRIPGEVYTLQNFTGEEIQILSKLFPEIGRDLFKIPHD